MVSSARLHGTVTTQGEGEGLRGGRHDGDAAAEQAQLAVGDLGGIGHSIVTEVLARAGERPLRHGGHPTVTGG